MKWIFGALFGLVIAFCIYELSGTVCSLVIGPLLGYKVIRISFWGMDFTKENGKYRFGLTEFHFVPQVFLETNVKSRMKKLILDVFPVILGFVAGMVLSGLFGGIRGFGRHILIGTLSAMAVIYCWHIFIVLKMIVYIRENRKK